MKRETQLPVCRVFVVPLSDTVISSVRRGSRVHTCKWVDGDEGTVRCLQPSLENTPRKHVKMPALIMKPIHRRCCAVKGLNV